MDIFSYILGKKAGGGGGEPKIPSEYQEVEYIEGSGTQYINTNYMANSDSQFGFKITYKTNSGIVFGAYNSGWTTGYGYYHNGNNGDNEWEHYYGNFNTTYKGSENTTQEVYINRGTVYIDNEFVFMRPTKTFSLSYPIFIFAGNWYGQRAEQPLPCKIYYFTIGLNDTLIMNLVPCYRKSDGEVGMYDTIAKKFYTNAGTGEFIKGPDVK